MIEFLNNIGGSVRTGVSKTVDNVVHAAPTIIITGVITGGALYLGQHMAKAVLTSGEEKSENLLNK